MLNHSGMRYDKNRLAKYQYHISQYSSTEMGRIKNDISAKIFPSMMEVCLGGHYLDVSSEGKI
jgi:hypothetical protein